MPIRVTGAPELCSCSSAGDAGAGLRPAGPARAHLPGRHVRLRVAVRRDRRHFAGECCAMPPEGLCCNLPEPALAQCLGVCRCRWQPCLTTEIACSGAELRQAAGRAVRGRDQHGGLRHRHRHRLRHPRQRGLRDRRRLHQGVHLPGAQPLPAGLLQMSTLRSWTFREHSTAPQSSRACRPPCS
jgi:hypothetical protein